MLMRMMRMWLAALVVIAPLSLVSCGSDTYDTGDGPLSYLRADFVEANTDASAAIVSVTDDEGRTYRLTREVKASWAEKADTAYRALAYYNARMATEGGDYVAEPVAMTRVLTPSVRIVTDLRDVIKTDPVTLESSWKSRNGKYINLDMSVLTGAADDEATGHTVGMLCDGVTLEADGHQLVRLRLYHDRGAVPEYYTAKVYVSVPVSYLPVTLSEGDKVEIKVNTYDGLVTKTFVF